MFKFLMVPALVFASLNAFAGGGTPGDKVCPGGTVVGPWSSCPGQASKSYRCEYPKSPITIVKVGVTTFAGHEESDFVVAKLYSEKLFNDFTWNRASALGKILSRTAVALKSNSSSKLNLNLDVATGRLRGTARGKTVDQRGTCVQVN